MFGEDVELDHVLPHDPAKVREQQPWLTDAHFAYAEIAGRNFNEHMRQFRMDREEWMGPETETSEETYEANKRKSRRYSFFTHFILSARFEIVEEPNPIRWSLFLELAGKHRVIERTHIHDGSNRAERRMTDYHENSWAQQQRRLRKREQAPSMFGDEIEVSTVFIGTCPGELFETMIFGGWLDGRRYKNATLLDAKKCHFHAADLARKHMAHMRKHGKARRKDWVRMERFWRLARKRGKEWAIKQIEKMEQVNARLNSIPGDPPIPQGSFLLDLATGFLPRPTLVEDPLVDNPD